MATQLLHEVKNGSRGLVPELAIRKSVIDHTNKETTRREQTAAGCDRSAHVASVVQAAYGDDHVERASSKGRRENVAPNGFARKSALAQTVINHGDGVGGDIKANEDCPAFCQLLRDSAVAETDFETRLPLRSAQGICRSR